MIKTILQEFSGLTNEQAYVHVFSKRVMKPIANRPGEFFGCDQRIVMLPYILECVAALPKGGQIFDVGAGAGEVVDFALKNAPEGTIVNIEEPNPSLIKAYLSKLKNTFHLQAGIAYEGPVEDYYRGGGKGVIPPQCPQDLILAIHMIYHLTDFTSPRINAEGDLIEFLTFLYGLLAPGGSIFIVYADLLPGPKNEAVCSMAERYFRHAYPNECYADNLISIYKARNNLLGPSGTIDQILLERYPKTKPKLKSELTHSHFFGDSSEEIAILGLATELCPSNSYKFDLTKLEFCLNYVSHYPERIGLQKEEGEVPQKGMWRANEPQVIATITKK